MGEIADLVLSGLLCQMCGTLMDDHLEPGYPRTCDDCKPRRKRPANGHNKSGVRTPPQKRRPDR